MFHDFYVRLVMCIYPHWLQYLKHQTYEDCQRAVFRNPRNIQHVRLTGHEYDEIYLLAFRFMHCHDMSALELWTLLKNPSTRICVHLVLSYPEIYLHMDKTENFHYEMIMRDPSMIRLIAEPSEFICQKAVSGDPEAIQYIDKPSDVVCSMAVSKNGLALRFINEPSKTICMEALESGPACVWQYIEHLDTDMVVQALTSWKRCCCGCLFTIPIDLLHEALPIAIKNDPDVLDLCTTLYDAIVYDDSSPTDYELFSDKCGPLFQLTEEEYIHLALIGSKSHCLEQILGRVRNRHLVDKIEKMYNYQAPKNARSVISYA